MLILILFWNYCKICLYKAPWNGLTTLLQIWFKSHNWLFSRIIIYWWLLFMIFLILSSLKYFKTTVLFDTYFIRNQNTDIAFLYYIFLFRPSLRIVFLTRCFIIAFKCMEKNAALHISDLHKELLSYWIFHGRY